MIMPKTKKVNEFTLIKKGEIQDHFFHELTEFASYEQNYSILRLVNGGKALKTQHYVGTITTKSHHVLEIYPKITSNNNDDDDNYDDMRRVLYKMLQSVPQNPFKKLDGSVHHQPMPISDVFIGLFLQELKNIIMNIHHDYVTIQKNLPYVKGKLDITQQCKYNIAHKEVFAVIYDERSPNILENQIIKATLHYLYPITETHKMTIRKYLTYFDAVTPLRDQDTIKQWSSHRMNQHYQPVIELCKIFLQQHSFTSYSGKHIALALLFDMNKLFEAYATRHIKKHYGRNYIITAQDSRYNLIEEPKSYRMKPDIVMAHKHHPQKKIIIDVKWKNLHNTLDNKPSIHDLYQLYAYAKKYHSAELALLYPASHSDITQPIRKYDEASSLYIFYMDIKKDIFIDPPKFKHHSVSY